MNSKSKLTQWLGVLALGAGVALGVSRSAKANAMPGEGVSIVVTDAATGNIIAGYNAGLHTGPYATTPPFSINSTQFSLPFTGAGLGGVTIPNDQFTADTTYPSGGLGQYLEGIFSNITNTNSFATNVEMIVSAESFFPNNGSDKVVNLNLSGSLTGAAGSSITAQWFEDNGDGGGAVYGAVGSPPILFVPGSQVGGTFSFTAPDNGIDTFSDTQNNLPLNSSNQFAMTMFYTIHLTPGAVENHTQTELAGVYIAPLPGTTAAGLALMGILLAGGAWRRLRKSTAA